MPKENVWGYAKKREKTKRETYEALTTEKNGTHEGSKSVEKKRDSPYF
jgi:hypothetical protein